MLTKLYIQSPVKYSENPQRLLRDMNATRQGQNRIGRIVDVEGLKELDSEYAINFTSKRNKRRHALEAKVDSEMRAKIVHDLVMIRNWYNSNRRKYINLYIKEEKILYTRQIGLYYYEISSAEYKKNVEDKNIRAYLKISFKPISFFNCDEMFENFIYNIEFGEFNAKALENIYVEKNHHFIKLDKHKMDIIPKGLSDDEIQKLKDKHYYDEDSEYTVETARNITSRDKDNVDEFGELMIDYDPRTQGKKYVHNTMRIRNCEKMMDFVVNLGLKPSYTLISDGFQMCFSFGYTITHNEKSDYYRSVSAVHELCLLFNKVMHKLNKGFDKNIGMQSQIGRMIGCCCDKYDYAEDKITLLDDKHSFWKKIEWNDICSFIRKYGTKNDAEAVDIIETHCKEEFDLNKLLGRKNMQVKGLLKQHFRDFKEGRTLECQRFFNYINMNVENEGLEKDYRITNKGMKSMIGDTKMSLIWDSFPIWQLLGYNLTEAPEKLGDKQNSMYHKDPYFLIDKTSGRTLMFDDSWGNIAYHDALDFYVHSTGMTIYEINAMMKKILGIKTKAIARNRFMQKRWGCGIDAIEGMHKAIDKKVILRKFYPALIDFCDFSYCYDPNKYANSLSCCLTYESFGRWLKNGGAKKHHMKWDRYLSIVITRTLDMFGFISCSQIDMRHIGINDARRTITFIRFNYVSSKELEERALYMKECEKKYKKNFRGNKKASICEKNFNMKEICEIYGEVFVAQRMKKLDARHVLSRSELWEKQEITKKKKEEFEALDKKASESTRKMKEMIENSKKIVDDYYSFAKRDMLMSIKHYNRQRWRMKLIINDWKQKLRDRCEQVIAQYEMNFGNDLFISFERIRHEIGMYEELAERQAFKMYDEVMKKPEFYMYDFVYNAFIDLLSVREDEELYPKKLTAFEKAKDDYEWLVKTYG